MTEIIQNLFASCIGFLVDRHSTPSEKRYFLDPVKCIYQAAEAERIKFSLTLQSAKDPNSGYAPGMLRGSFSSSFLQQVASWTVT